MHVLQESPHHWVDARPFRMHTRRLLAETGLGIGELAAHARVPVRVLARLLAPGPRPLRKLCPVYARRLVLIDLDGLFIALATPVAADQAVLLARRLAAAGVPRQALLTALGGDELTLGALLAGARGTVLLRHELALCALAVGTEGVPVWSDDDFDEPLAA